MINFNVNQPTNLVLRQNDHNSTVVHFDGYKKLHEGTSVYFMPDADNCDHSILLDDDMSFMVQVDITEKVGSYMGCLWEVRTNEDGQMELMHPSRMFRYQITRSNILKPEGTATDPQLVLIYEQMMNQYRLIKEAFETGALKGEKGDKGDTGERGPVGPKGETGPQGEPGPKGDRGDTGLTGPKGETGQTGATGPQGPKGDTGDRGPQGDRGPEGPQGPAGKDGESYDDTEIKGEVSQIKKDLSDQAEEVSIQKTVAEGITYRYVNDESNTYQKNVPSKSVIADVQSIGGYSRKCSNLLNIDGEISDSKLLENITIENGIVQATDTSGWGGTYVIWGEKHKAGNYKMTMDANLDSENNCHILIRGYDDDGLLIENNVITSFLGANYSTYNTWYKSSLIQQFKNLTSPSITFTVGGCAYFEFGFAFADTSMTKSMKLSNIMLNEGSTALPFEPYFEGIRHAEVESVESDGMNLWNPNDNNYGTTDINIFGLTAVKNADGSITAYGTPTTSITRFSGRMYSVKESIFDETLNYYIFIDGVLYKGEIGDASSSGFKRIIFRDIPITFTQGTQTSFTFYPIISKGIPTSYKPYKQSITVPIPTPVTQLTGYGWGINDDVKNYVDFETKKYVQMVGKFVFNGSSGQNIAFDGSRFSIKVADSKTVTVRTEAICDRFSYEAVGSDDMGMFHGADNSMYFYNFSCVNAALFRDWLEVNPTTVYYQLETPIITDLSHLDLSAFECIGVEEGGTITFENPNKLDVPSKVRYLTKAEKPVTSVKINGTALAKDADGGVEIPIAKANTYGLNKFDGNYGINIGSYGEGNPYIKKAANWEIDLRNIDSYGLDFQPVVPTNLDYAVKAALTDGKGVAYTEAQKKNACERLGAEPKHGQLELIETITISESGITNIERDAEPNGTPYDFTAVSFKGTISKPDASGIIDVCAKNSSAWDKAYRRFAYGTCQSNAVKVSSGLICNLFGKQFSICNLPESKLSFSQVQIAAGNICTMDWVNVTQLSMSFSGNNENGFPVGTTLEIYAVRA